MTTCLILHHFCEHACTHLNKERFLNEDIITAIEAIDARATTTGPRHTALRGAACLILARQAIGEAAQRAGLPFPDQREPTPEELRATLEGLGNRALLEQGELEMLGLGGGRSTALESLNAAVEQLHDLVSLVRRLLLDVGLESRDATIATKLGQGLLAVCVSAKVEARSLLETALYLDSVVGP